MTRPKGLTKAMFENIAEKAKNNQRKELYIMEGSTMALLDATKPDVLSTNNEIRASIRETRAKLNEIINILNAR